jgi:hypothetical protein
MALADPQHASASVAVPNAKIKRKVSVGPQRCAHGWYSLRGMQAR